MKNFDEVNIEIKATLVIRKGRDQDIVDDIRRSVTDMVFSHWPHENISVSMWNVDEQQMGTIIEYIMCYSTAFVLGFLVGCAVTYMIQKEIQQDDVC